MKELALQEIVDAIKGKVIAGDDQLKIRRVTKRPERLVNNTLFFNISKVDLSKLVPKENASIAVVTDNVNGESITSQPGITVVAVKSISKAFKRFISYYRSLFSIPVIGITGTVGKTTTKEMVKHILSYDFKVQSTYKSQNGLSLNYRYLLGIDERTQAAVFEMGVSHPENLRISGKYFKPQVGVITNIGVAHLEGCKTLDKYILAKAEILEALSYTGKLILNADDENIRKIDTSPFQGEILYFGSRENADYIAENISYSTEGMEYTLSHKGINIDAFVPGYGEQNVWNSLAAISAVHAIGVKLEEAVERLKNFKHLERHMCFYKGINNSIIIDDTWNCNPSSMKAALKVLKSTSCGKREIAVLGKLQRLGIAKKEQHELMGKTLVNLGGCDLLVTVGEDAALIGKTAIELGMNKKQVIFTYNEAELEKALINALSSDTVALFKMSLDKMSPSYRKALSRFIKNK